MLNQEMEEMFQNSGIEFIGLRFDASDARAAAYDSRIVQLQWCALPKLLSDQEAKTQLNKK